MDSLSHLKRDELYQYLKEMEMYPDDIKIFEEENYDGQILMLLKEKKQLYHFKRRLSSHGQLKLEAILGYDEMTDGPSLEPQAEYDKYTAFGLGCGIDGSYECVPSSSARKVRSVLPDLSNLAPEEQIHSGEESFSKEYESKTTHNAKVNVLLTDIVASHLNFGGGINFRRHQENSVTIEGKKKVIRTVRFKKFERDHPDSPEESNFERRFCKWLTANIPDIEKSPGNGTVAKVQNYVASNPEKFSSVVDEAYQFLLVEKVTHYVDAVDLGAAWYSTNITSSTESTDGANFTAGAQAVGEGKISLSHSKIDSTKNAEVKEIGKFDDVDRWKNENVVRYELLPVTKLCTQRKVADVLSKAIEFFLDKASGPYYIKGGERFDRYLQVSPDKKFLKATKAKEDASDFYLERDSNGSKAGKFKFRIEHRDEDDRSIFVTLHNDWKSKAKRAVTGNQKCPLPMSKSNHTLFSVRHFQKDKDHDFDFWEKKPCFIKIKSTGKVTRHFKHKSFLGLCMDTNNSLQVGDIDSQEKKSNISLQFKIERKRKLNHSPCSNTRSKRQKLNS